MSPLVLWWVLNMVHVSKHRFIIIFYFSESEIATSWLPNKNFAAMTVKFFEKSTFLESAAPWSHE